MYRFAYKKLILHTSFQGQIIQFKHWNFLNERDFIETLNEA